MALMPDLTYILIQRVFFPTPTDVVMRIQKEKPEFKYLGFQNYDVNPNKLPDGAVGNDKSFVSLGEDHSA